MHILIPFLLAIFISVIANPIVKKLNTRGIPVSGSIIMVIIGIITLGIGITSLLGTSLNDFSENLPQYKILINKSGKVEDVYSSLTKPMSKKIVNKIEILLN